MFFKFSSMVENQLNPGKDFHMPPWLNTLCLLQAAKSDCHPPPPTAQIWTECPISAEIQR
jgi:hypothetical protein